MHTSLKMSVAGLLAASLVVASVAPSMALPGARDAGVSISSRNDHMSNASFRRHFYRGQSYHGAWHDRGLRIGSGLGYGGAALGAGLAGLAAGALLDDAASGQVQTLDADEAMDAAVAYCADRFKSYDPATGTYLGYDGYTHACPEG